MIIYRKQSLGAPGSLDQSLIERSVKRFNLAFSRVSILQTNLSQTLMRRTFSGKQKRHEKRKAVSY